MSDYFIYYASSNIVGAIIFGLMLIHDHKSLDRQEKQLKYDQALIAFLLYFISDTVWVAVDSGLIQANRISALATNLANFSIMTTIIYSWLRYVMAVEQVPNRNDMRVRIPLAFPFCISIFVLIITFIVDSDLLIDENMKSTGMFDLFLAFVPMIYLAAIIVYTIKKAKNTENHVERRKHLYIGFFPILTVVGGLIQVLLMPELPVFCFCSTIFMIEFFIQSIDVQISTDPLTRLNNRGQFESYINQESNLRIEGRKTYAVMMDINDFKMINDTFGHAEGDRALVILSQALIDSVRNKNMPIFLGRYGGDEFVLIAHPVTDTEIQNLLVEIREKVVAKCEGENRPYILSVGIGYEEFSGTKGTFSECMKQADEKLYKNKEELKKNGKSTKKRHTT